MRCRYCGKELALLKRLTGGGGFCSEAHKQSYQDEYNQLALSRLLQAQKKGETESSGTNTGTPVAIEELAAEEPVLEERAAHAPLLESAPLELSNLEASVSDQGTARDLAAGAVADPAEAQTNPGDEPSEMADFLIDSPAMATLPDETPYLDPWLEFSSGPAVADWQVQNGVPALSTASLVSLDLQPNTSPGSHPVAAVNLTPQEFANRHGQPSLPWKVTTMHQLPSAGPVLIEVSASAIDFAVDPRIAPNIAPGISPSIDGQLDRETAVLVEDSQLLELPFTGIEFPTEDSAVVVVFSQHSSQHKPPDSASSETEPAAPAEDDSPRASLEALSRLHQDLTQEDLTQEVLIEESPALVVEAEPQSPTPTLATLTPATPTPGRATELLDIAIRMFPPSKPAPMEGVGLPSQSEALLPHLKSLPLRPKMAVAYGYVPPSTAPAQPKATAAGAQTIAPSKPAPVARPVARIIQPKQQPKQPPTPAKAPEPSKAAATFQPPSPAQPEADASVKAAEQPAKPVAEEAAKEIAKSAAKQPAQQTARQRPDERTQETAPSTVSGTVANTAPSTVSNTVPNFGAVQLANPSFIGSLKVKLGIAIALLVVACSTWLGWGGKSHKPGASSAISTDGSGPSIILGEGGWVEDWAGDPSGVHSGREITIYRPSLKLSDYRVEFQASIETQSIGWVFRAADPDNYYALKLMTVSSGLSPKVALFKYLVLNGRQTQVGRVPIDLAVQADTVFNIRTDVRGPQFSTYIQGQLVDVWTDDQLKAGGVGFLNEREERGKVKSVSIRYINGSAK